MRFISSFSAILVVCLGHGAAIADMRAMISGAAPILPAIFMPRDQVGAVVPDSAKALASKLPGTPSFQPAEAPLPPPPGLEMAVWTRPLMDRKLGAEEKASDLAPDLADAILRIENSFDPTRVDAFAESPHFEVRAGTAVMNNVFADRWHLADTDANVHFSARYLAQAWMRDDGEPCQSYTKNRASNGGPVLSALSVSDCIRLTRLRDDKDEAWTRLTIAGAVLDVPVFAAPLPGSRVSSGDFWAAQKARILAIQARLRDKWQASGTTTAAR